MQFNNRIFYSNRKLPLYSIPAIVIAGFLLLLFTMFFGVLIGIFIVVTASGLLLTRLFSKPSRSKHKRVEDDGRTIVLREDEYKVIDKKN